jgi:hypothetical protein
MTRTDLLATIRHLRTLEKAATPSPWQTLRSGPWSRGAVVDERQTELCDFPYERADDARLTVEVRNALPELLDELERRLVERDEFMTDARGNRWRLVSTTATDHEPVRGED